MKYSTGGRGASEGDEFSSAAFSVGEGAGEVAVTVTRRGGSSGAVGVFTTFGPGGTATPGQDYPRYIDYVASLRWADGDVADTTFTVPILEDSSAEGDETFKLSLDGPTGGATLGIPGTTVVTVVDNDQGLLIRKPVGSSLERWRCGSHGTSGDRFPDSA